jgi:hypothetical protein
MEISKKREMGDNLGKQIASQGQIVQRDYNMIQYLKNQFLQKTNIKNKGVINQIHGKGLAKLPGYAGPEPTTGVPGGKAGPKPTTGVPGVKAGPKPTTGVPGGKAGEKSVMDKGAKGVKTGKDADKDIKDMEKTVNAEDSKTTDKIGADIKKSEQGMANSVKNVFDGKKGFAKTVNDLVRAVQKNVTHSIDQEFPKLESKVMKIVTKAKSKNKLVKMALEGDKLIKNVKSFTKKIKIHVNDIVGALKSQIIEYSNSLTKNIDGKQKKFDKKFPIVPEIIGKYKGLLGQ